jgi:hypothetical protein
LPVSLIASHVFPPEKFSVFAYFFKNGTELHFMSNKFQEYKQLDLSQINKEVLKRMKSIKETVNFSLQKTIDQQKRWKLLAMKGKIEWEGNLDEMRGL